MQYAGRITVEDPMGQRLQVHEFRGRRLFKTVRRYVLETGERVNCLDFDNYEIAPTGQKLLRIVR